MEYTPCWHHKTKYHPHWWLHFIRCKLLNIHPYYPEWDSEPSPLKCICCMKTKPGFSYTDGYGGSNGR